MVKWSDSIRSPMWWIYNTSRLPFIFSKNFSTQSVRTSLPQSSIPKKPHKNKKKHKQSPSKNLIQSPNTLLPHLENILIHDTHFRLLLKTKEFLSTQPDHSFPLSSAPFLGRKLGCRNLTRFLQHHPLLFTSRSSSDGKLWFGFSGFMETLIEEENSIIAAVELSRVTTLRKLLMMSSQKRIPLQKITKSRFLFGFCRDFIDRVGDYSNYFKVKVEEDGTRFLELIGWDKSLAVTKLGMEFMEDEDEAMKTFMFPFKKTKGFGLDIEAENKLSLLNTFPLVSPYSEGWKLEQGAVDAEKYRVGLVHEFLSLTLEKRASIHEIVEFREEFTLLGDLYSMLDNQAQTFYLGGTELNWSVFLRKAYTDDGGLICKDPQVVFHDKLKLHAQMEENTCKSFWK